MHDYQRVKYRFPIAAALLPFALFSAMPSHAQSVLTDRQDSCEVIIPKDYVDPAIRFNTAGAKRVSSHFETQSTKSVIANTGKVYTFRLAACILPEYIRTNSFASEGFGTASSTKDEVIAEVQKFWQELEDQLNAFYTNDVGIKFKVIRDPKLILFNRNDYGLNLDPNATDVTRLYRSKEIVDAVFGAKADETYDLGILIGRPNNGRNGVAALGSAASKAQKGQAWCVANYTSLAHEIGHSFGAEHTHQKSDAICTEPGSGRSIMSYGSPRDFFSLPSIYQMRNTLANMNYYTDESRTNLVVVQAGNETVTPVAEDEQGTQPVLDRQKIKTEYIITKGSNFQFYLPTTTQNDGDYLYNVNSFDIVKGDMERANTLRPSYKEVKNNCIVFTPHCVNPVNASESNYIEAYSDGSNLGTYTFMAAVHDHSRYDAMKIKLNVVEGEPFQINGLVLGHQTLNDRALGKEATISWNPCTEIYGTDSKVRILFSDDYGQTFKYVLADNVPNNGYCKFMLPYFTVGNVTNYEGWTNFTAGGGRFKIEVIGEAACSIYPTYDYSFQRGKAIGSSYTFKPSGQRYMFRTLDKQDPPAPYVEVASADKVPAKIEKLEAYSTSNANTTQQCTVVETHEGSLIRRSWTANFSGTPYTYTQLIKLPETVTEDELVKVSAQQIAKMAKGLYANFGKVGYPYSWLPEAKEFKAAYDKVYSGSDILSTATQEDVDKLNEVMTHLSQIADDEVVKPLDGHYYQIRSYLTPYDRDNYYYMVDDGQGQKLVSQANFNSYSDEQKKNARWRCYVKDGKYHFVGAQGQELFSPVVPEGTSWNNTISEFQNFSNQGMERTFQRGYTWGALTIINNQGWGCSVGVNGNFNVVRGSVNNGPMTEAERCNCQDGLVVSTDWQFVDTNETPYQSPVDSTLQSLGNDIKTGTDNGNTYYVQSATDGVNIVYAKATVTEGTNGRGLLKLPASVTVDGQAKAVVGIMAREITTKAKRDNKYTYSLGAAMGDRDFDLELPASVKIIDKKAFSGCAQLHTVTVPDNSALTTIGEEAFAGCANMTFSKPLVDAKQLTTIGAKAFSGTALRTLALNCQRSAIQTNAFEGAAAMEYLDLRQCSGTVSVTRTTAGLPKHTLVFTTGGSRQDDEANETNVVRFSGTVGTCQHLALYETTVDKGVYTRHGISIPRDGSAEGLSSAAFTAETVTYDRKFPKGYSTLCLPYAAPVPQGMTAYEFESRRSDNGEDTYTFRKTAGQIEANKAYLVYCTAADVAIAQADNVQVPGAARYTVGDAVSKETAGNVFAGAISTLGHDDAIGHNIYIIQADTKWHRVTDLNGTIHANAFVPPFRAFFIDGTVAAAKSISMAIDNDIATGISVMNAGQTRPLSTDVYSLDGRLVGHSADGLPRGIYVIGGKKFVVK